MTSEELSYSDFLEEIIAAIQAGDTIDIRVIGQRYELNDKYISVIGEYIPSKRPGKPNKLVFKDK